jgi:hypothetical protein
MPSHTTDKPASFNMHADRLAERAEHLSPLWLMSREERLATFHRGDMTQEQMFAWAARCPREVPRINGEFAFIAASTPEAGLTCPVCHDDEVTLVAGGALAKHPDHRHPFDPTNPYAPRPTCPASHVTPADAVGISTTTATEQEYALAA